MDVSRKHYHILWSNLYLAWQAFQTKEEAEKQAERLKRPGETHLIVEQDGECSRCMEMNWKVRLRPGVHPR